jgi:hypothetical protein
LGFKNLSFVGEICNFERATGFFCADLYSFKDLEPGKMTNIPALNQSPLLHLFKLETHQVVSAVVFINS